MTSGLDEQHRKALARAESLPPFHETQAAVDHQRRARERAAFARDLFQRVLAGAPHMTHEDVRVTEVSDENVRVGARVLFAELDKLSAEDPAAASKIWFGLDFLTSGLFLGASRATISDSGMALYRREHTKPARKAKKQKPRARALREAISDALRSKYNDTVQRPKNTTAAKAIVEEVNRRLPVHLSGGATERPITWDALRHSPEFAAGLDALFPPDKVSSR